MALYDDAARMVELVHQHVRSTRHEIIEASDPQARTLGFACVECRDAGSQGRADTLWEVGLGPIKALPAEHPLRGYLVDQAGRERLLAELNEASGERFFVGFTDYFLLPDERPIPDVLWDLPEELEAQRLQEARVTRAREQYEARCHAAIPDRFMREDPLEPSPCETGSELDPPTAEDLRNPCREILLGVHDLSPRQEERPWPRLRQVEDDVWMLEDGDKDIDCFTDKEEGERAVLELLRSRGLVP